MIYLYIYNQSKPNEVKWIFDKYIVFLNFLKSLEIIQTKTNLNTPNNVIRYFNRVNGYIYLTSYGDFVMYKKVHESSSVNIVIRKLDKQCENYVYEAIRNDTEIPWAQRSESIKEYCVKCEQFKDSKYFRISYNGKTRNTCYSCKYYEQQEREQKRIIYNDTRICRSCRIEKYIQGNFDNGSCLCYVCEYQQRLGKRKKSIKLKEKGYAGSENPPKKEKHTRPSVGSASTQNLQNILNICIEKQITFTWNDLVELMKIDNE